MEGDGDDTVEDEEGGGRGVSESHIVDVDTTPADARRESNPHASHLTPLVPNAPPPLPPTFMSETKLGPSQPSMSGDGVLLPSRTPAQLASLLAVLGLSTEPVLERPGSVYCLSWPAFRRLLMCQVLFYGRPVTVRSRGNEDSSHPDPDALRVCVTCRDPDCPFHLETLQERAVSFSIGFGPPLEPTVVFQRVLASHSHHCTVRDHASTPLLNDEVTETATATTCALLQLDRHVSSSSATDLAQRLRDAYGLDYACSPQRLAELERALSRARQRPTNQTLFTNSATAADAASNLPASKDPPAATAGVEYGASDDKRAVMDVQNGETLQRLPAESSDGRRANEVKRRREPSSDPASHEDGPSVASLFKRHKIRHSRVEESEAATSPAPAPPLPPHGYSTTPSSSGRRSFGGRQTSMIWRNPALGKRRSSEPLSPPLPETYPEADEIATTAEAPKRRGRPPKARPPLESAAALDLNEPPAGAGYALPILKRRGRKPRESPTPPSGTPESDPQRQEQLEREESPAELPTAAQKRRGLSPKESATTMSDRPAPTGSATASSVQDESPAAADSFTSYVAALSAAVRRGRRRPALPALSMADDSSVQKESAALPAVPKRRGRPPKDLPAVPAVPKRCGGPPKKSATAKLASTQLSVQDESPVAERYLLSTKHRDRSPSKRSTITSPPPASDSSTDSSIKNESPTTVDDLPALSARPIRRGRWSRKDPIPSLAPAARELLITECLMPDETPRAAEGMPDAKEAPKRRGRWPRKDSAGSLALGAPERAIVESLVQDESPTMAADIPNATRGAPEMPKRRERPPRGASPPKLSLPAPDPPRLDPFSHDKSPTTTQDLPPVAPRREALEVAPTTSQDTRKKYHGTPAVGRGLPSLGRPSIMNPAALQTLARTTTTDPMDSLATATLPAMSSRLAFVSGYVDGERQRRELSPPQSLPETMAIRCQPELQMLGLGAEALDAPRTDRKASSRIHCVGNVPISHSENSASPLKAQYDKLDCREWLDQPPLMSAAAAPERICQGPVATIESGCASFAQVAATVLPSKIRLIYQGSVFEAVREAEAGPKRFDGHWFQSMQEFGPWLEAGQQTEESRALRFSAYPFLFRPSIQGLADEFQKLASQDACLPTRLASDCADSLRKSVDAKLLSLRSHEDKNEDALKEVEKEQKDYRRSLAALRRGEEQELLAKLKDEGDAVHRSRQMWNAAHRCTYRAAKRSHEATAAALTELASLPVVFESKGRSHVTTCEQDDCATCRGSDQFNSLALDIDVIKRPPMPRHRTVETLPYAVSGNLRVDSKYHKAKMTILKLHELRHSVPFVSDFARTGSHIDRQHKSVVNEMG